MFSKITHVRPVEYRVIVIILTATDFAPEPSEGYIKDALCKAWSSTQRKELPSSLRESLLPTDVFCQAIVFHLKRTSDYSLPKLLRREQSWDALEHLVKAGLWTKEELDIS